MVSLHTAGSIVQFKSKLNLPSRILRLGKAKCSCSSTAAIGSGRDHPIALRSTAIGRYAKDWRIRQIDELCHELHVDAMVNRELFGHIQIGGLQSGAPERTHAAIPESPLGREGHRCRIAELFAVVSSYIFQLVAAIL